MLSLNSANSGVASKRDLLKRGPCVSRALGVPLSLRPSAMLHHFCFAGQLLVSQATANNLFHSEHEAVNIVSVAVIKPERLFIDVPEQVERLNRDIVPFKPRFRSAQKFSMPFV